MNKKFFKGLYSALLCFMLITAMAFTSIGCGKKTENKVSSEQENKASFTFIMTDIDGTQKTFNISTDKKTVGEALLEEKLIEGENSEYGLYVKKVDGIVADYSVDGTYWAFYINGEYAMTGVDSTDVVDGATYSFVKTK